MTLKIRKGQVLQGEGEEGSVYTKSYFRTNVVKLLLVFCCWLTHAFLRQVWSIANRWRQHCCVLTRSKIIFFLRVICPVKCSVEHLSRILEKYNCTRHSGH